MHTDFAEAEFLNRTRSPKIARELFRDVYIDNKAWKSTVTSKLLQERVEYVLRTFGKFRTEVDMDSKREVDLESFLVRHTEIFERVTEAKQLARDDPHQEVPSMATKFTLNLVTLR